MKFRKKPVIIEAIQWQVHGDSPQVEHYLVKPDESGSPVFCQYCGLAWCFHGWVKTLEGGHIVCPNDWIIQGVKGEFYPCQPDIFEQTYERVE